MGQRESSSRTVVAVHQPLIRLGVHKLAAHAGLDPYPDEIFDFDSLLAFLVRVPVSALIILCSALPGLNGVRGVHKLRARFRNQPILVIVEQPRRDSIMELISEGADGVIPLATDSDTMVRAMIAVSSGAMYVPRIAEDNSSARDDAAAERNVSAVSPSTASLGSLTERQREILHWLTVGETNKMIGRRLDISPNTVKIHVRTIFRALGVHHRVEAVNKLAALSLDAGFDVLDPSRRSEDHGRSSIADGSVVSGEPGFNFS